MFDIGFWEMSLIAIIGLIVLGPERMPKVVQKVGYWVGRLRAQAFNVRAQIEQEINADELRQALYQQEQEIRNLQIMMEEAGKKAQQGAENIESNVQEEMKPLIHPELQAQQAETSQAAPISSEEPEKTDKS